MQIDETKFTQEGKDVVALLRTEIAAQRIPEKDAKYLASAVKVYESVGILSGFVVKLAAFIAALGAVLAALKAWEKA